jgi:hypothetical protein
VIAVGASYVGDQANLNDKLPAYWLAGTHVYQLRKDLQIFRVVNNVFNQKFATHGIYFEPQSVITPTCRRAHRPAHADPGAAAVDLCGQGRSCDFEST